MDEPGEDTLSQPFSPILLALDVLRDKVGSLVTSSNDNDVILFVEITHDGSCSIEELLLILERWRWR